MDVYHIDRRGPTDEDDAERIHADRRVKAYAAKTFGVDRLTEVRDANLAKVSFRRRPQFGEVLRARIQPGDVILAARLDDLCSSARDCQRLLKELQKTGVRVYLVGRGQLTERDANVFAELEHVKTRERALDVHASRRTAGRHGSGSVPFGYVAQDGFLVAEPEQQQAIGRMRALRAENTSFRKIAAAIRHEFGLTVSAFGVQRIVENKRKLDEDAIRRRASKSEPRKRFNANRERNDDEN